MHGEQGSEAGFLCVLKLVPMNQQEEELLQSEFWVAQHALVCLHPSTAGAGAWRAGPELHGFADGAAPPLHPADGHARPRCARLGVSSAGLNSMAMAPQQPARLCAPCRVSAPCSPPLQN